jgi:hypothetical protein
MLRLSIFGHNPWCRRARLVDDLENPLFVAIPNGTASQVVPVRGIGLMFAEKTRNLLFHLFSIHPNLQLETAKSGDLASHDFFVQGCGLLK